MGRIKVYQPGDKITFGKYEGEDWRFAYTFEPDYIEWLIKSKDWFAIDFDAFKDLHTAPVPKTLIGSEKYLTINNEPIQVTDYIRRYLSSIKDYTDPPEEPRRHVFSERTLTTLYNKFDAQETTDHEPEIDDTWEAAQEDTSWEERYNRYNNEYDLRNPSYCGVCESAPCMCSNKGRTSETYNW